MFTDEGKGGNLESISPTKNTCHYTSLKSWLTTTVHNLCDGTVSRTQLKSKQDAIQLKTEHNNIKGLYLK